MVRPLLIAGIGNLFFGDDAFGCEVTRRLHENYPRLRDGVELRDFGVGVRALGYALAERTASGASGTIVIVDAVATGAAPGTLQLFDLAAEDVPSLLGSAPVVHHAQGLEDALGTARALGACLEGTYLLGCEPACFEPAVWESGVAAGCLLTPCVEAAARRCVALLGRMIEQPDEDLVALCQI